MKMGGFITLRKGQRIVMFDICFVLRKGVGNGYAYM